MLSIFLGSAINDFILLLVVQSVWLQTLIKNQKGRRLRSLIEAVWPIAMSRSCLQIKKFMLLLHYAQFVFFTMSHYKANTAQ